MKKFQADVLTGGGETDLHSHSFDALSPLTTQGDTLYHNGTNNVRLAKGTALQYLRMNSGATAPEWATLNAGFPSGTKMLFNQTAAPTGWTKDTTAALNDTGLRVVTGTVGSGGSVAFSTVFGKTATDGYTLLIADMPSHTHSEYVATAVGGPYTCPAPTGWTNAGIPQYGYMFTGATGGDGSHSHGIDIRLKYNDVIIASKD